MSDAVHARGCREEGRPSVLLPGYRFCPSCKRLIKET